MDIDEPMTRGEFLDTTSALLLATLVALTQAQRRELIDSLHAGWLAAKAQEKPVTAEMLRGLRDMARIGTERLAGH